MAKSKSMDRVRNAFWGAQQKETDVIPGVGNVAKKHSSKKQYSKQLQSL